MKNAYFTIAMNVAIRVCAIALIATVAGGCAVPIGVKRCYVETWDHFYPVSTNEVAK